MKHAQGARRGQRVARGLVLAGVLLSSAVSQALERPVIDIEGAHFRPFPVAIPDFKPKAGEGQELTAGIAQVVRDDLALSGLFQVLDPRSFIASPEREGITQGTIAFPAWLNVGADGLVKAQVELQDATLAVELHVFDVVRGRETFKERFSEADIQPRRMAHRLADALIQHYTGEKGVFQSRIAYVQRRGQGKDICTMDVDGFNVDCAVKNGVLNLLPAWDGGGALLFTSYLGGSTDLYRVQLGSRDVSVVSRRPGLNSGAAVSPDGKTIALTLSQDGNSEIYLLDREGQQPRRLTYDTFAIDSSPAWSPDGSQLAFVSDRGGSPQLYVMKSDGTEVRRLTFQGNYNQTPEWSPRGDRIAFTARDERNVFDVFTVDVASGRVTRITQDQGNNEEPTWAPNGRLLAFVSDRGGQKAIWVSDPEGRNQRRVSRGSAPCYTPSWSPLLTNLK